MRNLHAVIACLVMSLIVVESAAVPARRNRKKNDFRLKSFTDRYALPTDIHAIKASLPLTFGYRFTDDYGTVQSREEKTDPNGSKTGSYSFVDATGLYRRVEYIADHHGFRATVTTNEPGTLAVDPAHVRMLAENKNFGHGSFSHTVGNSPQLEYSSNIFSKFNHSGGYDDSNSNYPSVVQNFATNGQNSFIPKSPIFESERIELENPKVFNSVNNYKGSSFSPEITSLLHELEDPQPVVSGQKQNSGNFFDDPNINPGLIFDDKTSGVGYPKRVPTRYPRRHRDSRTGTKKRTAYKIHIPKGYEDNHHELPLYRDK